MRRGDVETRGRDAESGETGEKGGGDERVGTAGLAAESGETGEKGVAGGALGDGRRKAEGASGEKKEKMERFDEILPIVVGGRLLLPSRLFKIIDEAARGFFGVYR